MKCPVCNRNIADDSLKCPYCKTRTGLLCSHCNTVNSIGSFICKKCGTELLKICPHCNSVNFPSATKCRKCGQSFSPVAAKKNVVKKNISKKKITNFEFVPKLFSPNEALQTLTGAIKNKDKKIISLTGAKGMGKSTVLKKAVESLDDEAYKWAIGKCTQLSQLTPGGVIRDLFLNIFNLPQVSVENEDFFVSAKFFLKKEFKFLNQDEIVDFLNFLYNFRLGNYEDIIINKKNTTQILMKIFEAFLATGKFIIVVDNFDFIDGFSIEFFTHLMRVKNNLKNMKFIALYNNPKPIRNYFILDEEDDIYCDINLAPWNVAELNTNLKFTNFQGQTITQREREVIFGKSKGNPAYVEQAIAYSFDCQYADKAFILPVTFSDLLKERLKTLRKINPDAFKFLCAGAVVGDRLNLILIKEILEFVDQQFEQTVTYLENLNFIRKYNDFYYEFNNLYLWETILKNITNNAIFEEINQKFSEVISKFNLNTNAILAMIAHNLKENRMAFDCWTRITRLACYIGDINLYVICQKQCLALLNEFNEDETLEIRRNISERLGKLLAEYDPEEAMEYLPDAVSFSKSDANEIELLGYLAKCCRQTGNYFGQIECIDRVVNVLTPEKELEKALLLAEKLPSLIDIGNCGEVINLVDNDVLPVLNSYLEKEDGDLVFPLGFLYDTRLKVYLAHAQALVLQGSSRVFTVLSELFTLISKYMVDDTYLISRAKLVEAYANTVKGDYRKSEEILTEIGSLGCEEPAMISRWNCINVINKFMQKEYVGIQELMFDAVTYANNCADSFSKNILKVMLGKMFYDRKENQRAVEIYNEQITYFAKEKMALGALLSWYFIAQATENPKNSNDIALQALEIAQNPRINNYFFSIKLKMILAKNFIKLEDFQSAKMYIDTALALSTKYEMNDLTAQLFVMTGDYYLFLNRQEKKMRDSAIEMYEKAKELTQNTYFTKVLSQKINDLSKIDDNVG